MSNEKSFLRSRSSVATEEAWRILRFCFRQIDSWHAQVADPRRVHASSPLGAADGLTEPYQASHRVGYLVLTAVDHLHALRMLMEKAHAQHIFAPFTLIRSALENAATVLWILGESDPRRIAMRTMRLQYANLREFSNAYETIGADGKELAPRMKILDDLIRKNRMKGSGIKANPPGTLKILQAASQTFRLGSSPVLMWQMCSAATHGKEWASLFFAMMEAHDDGESKVLNGRLTSDEQAIAVALATACDVLERAMTTVQAHSRAPGHTGDSFRPSAPQLVMPQQGLYLPLAKLPR